MRFNATGNLVFNSLESKLPWKREGKTKNGDKYLSLNIAVASSKANRMMTDAFGCQQDEIKTMDTDNNKISIAWDDRNDPEVKAKVANYRKHIVDLGDDDRKEFISDYDFVKYLEENVDKLKNGNYVVTGSSVLNEYNGKLSQRFQMQNIYKADDDAKCQLKVTFDFYYTSAEVDFADWKEEKKIRISGYTTSWVSAEKKNMYVAQDVVMDCSKIDEDNPKHVKLLQYKLKQLGLSYEDGKIKNNLKKNKVYNLPIICNYFNGSEEVAFDESMLNDNQKMAIELGLKTLESFIPAGSKMYGDRIIEYHLVDFDLRGKYEDGAIQIDDTTSEFEENIYTPVAPESEEELLDKAIEKKNKKKDDDEWMNKPESDDDEDDLADLFD